MMKTRCFFFSLILLLNAFQAKAQTYTLSIASNNEQWGMVSLPQPLPDGVVDNGDGTYTIETGVEVTLTATPLNSCYDFLKWSDDVTEPTRSIGDNASLTAIFTLHPYEGDTTASVCDSFVWHGQTFASTPDILPTHVYSTMGDGCDSVVTLNLTIRHSSQGIDLQNHCDSLTWIDGQTYTVSNNTAQHLLEGANAEQCDSTVTLNLTIRHSSQGIDHQSHCDTFQWFNGQTYTEDNNIDQVTLRNINAEGCDSTVTLNLTIRHSSQGVDLQNHCDSYTWIDGQTYTSSNNTAQQLLEGANVEQCDSTVMLNLVIRHSSQGIDTQIHCDSYIWIDSQTYIASNTTAQYLLTSANAEECDSLVTLNLTINYQNTGDTNAVSYEAFNWYEHTDMSATQNVSHVFPSANQWGCDSIVTLHLRYALFEIQWAGDTTVVYNAQPQTGVSAFYVDDSNRVQEASLIFINGLDTIISPDFPVNAGVWNIMARPLLPVDSVANDTATLIITPAIVSVSDAAAEEAKFFDGNTDAVVLSQGLLNGLQGNDSLIHTTLAYFSDSAVGENKIITFRYAIDGDSAMLGNYILFPDTSIYSTDGAIIEAMTPDNNRQGDDTTLVENGMDVYAYGYCSGDSYRIRYHLNSGNPDQYKIDFPDSRFVDVSWSDLQIPGAEGFIEIDVPVDLSMGDYSLTVTFRDSRYPWLESIPLTISFHVNLPETYTMPLFDDLIVLVDTCHCFTDIQWFHRANASWEWQAILGANDYSYYEEGGLTGEYFVRAKMNGVETYTCAQTDMSTLIEYGEEKVSITAHPNPATQTVTISVLNAHTSTHVLRMMNIMGIELIRADFVGDSVLLNVSDYPKGSYMVVVDGAPVRLIKN